MQPVNNNIDATEDTVRPNNNDPFTSEGLGKAFMNGFLERLTRRYPTQYNFKNDKKYAATKMEKAQAKRDRRARRNIEIVERNQRNAEALKNAQTYGRAS